MARQPRPPRLATWRIGALVGRVDPTAGVRTAWIFALSPQAVLLGASQMSHALVLLLGLLAVEAALDRRSLSLGFAVGAALLTRPLCGALLLPLLLWRRDPRALPPVLLAVCLQAAVNDALGGAPEILPVNHYFSKLAARDGFSPDCNSLGFGADRGCVPGATGHSLPGAAANAAHNLKLWALLLLGSPVLLLPALFTRLGRRLLLVPVAVVMAYSLYWYEGAAYGARFYHLALPAVVAAVGLGLARVPRWATVVVAGGALVRLALVAPGLRGYWGVDGGLVATGEPGVVLLEVVGDRRHPLAPVGGPRSGVQPSWVLEVASANADLRGEPWFTRDTPAAREAAQRSGLAVLGRGALPR